MWLMAWLCLKGSSKLCLHCTTKKVRKLTETTHFEDGTTGSQNIAKVEESVRNV